MKEQEWKDLFQNEMNAVHAPVELIELTKQKAADEERKNNSVIKRKRLTYVLSGISAIAAIIVLFIVSSSLLGNHLVQEKQNGTKILLGNNTGKEIYIDEQVEIEHTAVLPIEFVQNDVWEEEIEGIKVKFCCTDDGNYLAAYEKEDSYVVIRCNEKDQERMKEILISILMD